jgi:prepilin-type N-terminal cleavage/methylation domain-containing protein
MRRPTARPTPPTPAPRRRGAFTLIELMIVIVIIGILAGLVLPAVMGAFKTARIAQVQTEIRGLESAVAQFKALYGIEPPSRIRLFETQAGWQTPAAGTTVDQVTGGTLNNETERTRSIAFINRIWPQFNYSIPHDFDADGTSSGFVTLFGSECLVFFLGGVATGPVGGPFALTGFSKNPADPFTPSSGTESRDGPFFEFKTSRLHKSNNSQPGGPLVYFDPLPGQTLAYLYASSYDGRGYQASDLYYNQGSPGSPTTYVAPTSPPQNLNMFSVYFAGSTPQKNKSFQLISPGMDFTYGSGGPFDPTAANHSLVDRRDYDNITNFNSGTLNR